MATTDLERLVLTISADTGKITKALAKLQADANKSMSGVEKSTRRADASLKRLEKTVTGVAANAKAFAINRAFALIAGTLAADKIIDYADAWTQAQNALKVSGVAAGDLAPTMERIFQIAQDTGSALGPLVTLYSRAAQVSKELGASQEQLFTFTTGVANALKVAGTSSSEASGALLQLSQALGGAKIQAEEFNSINDGARPILQAVANGLNEAGGSVAKLKALVNDGQVSNKAFFQAFLAGSSDLGAAAQNAESTVGQSFTRLTNAFTKFIGEMSDASGAATALSGYIDTVSTAFEWLASQGDAVSAFLDDVVRGFATVDAAAQTLAGNINKLFDGIFGTQSYINNRIGGAFAAPFSKAPLYPQANKGDLPSSSGTGVSLKDFPVVASGGGSGGAKRGGGGAAKQSDFERELARSKERIASITEEAKALDLFAGNSDKAAAYTDLLVAAQKDKKPLDEQLLALIKGQAEAQGNALATLDATRQRYDDLNATMQEISDTARDALGGFLGDLAHGAKASDALRNSLSRVLDTALQLSLNGLFNAGKTGSSGTGIIGQVLGGLFGGFRAAGGPVQPGKAYVVGERRPEVFVPQTSGTIIPSVGQGGGSFRAGDNIFNVQGDISEKTARMMAAMIARNNRELAYQNANSWRDN